MSREIWARSQSQSQYSCTHVLESGSSFHSNAKLDFMGQLNEVNFENSTRTSEQMRQPRADQVILPLSVSE